MDNNDLRLERTRLAADRERPAGPQIISPVI